MDHICLSLRLTIRILLPHFGRTPIFMLVKGAVEPDDADDAHDDYLSASLMTGYRTTSARYFPLTRR